MKIIYTYLEVELEHWFLRTKEIAADSEKSSKQGREPETNHPAGDGIRESNPGHSGWHQELATLHHTCSLSALLIYGLSHIKELHSHWIKRSDETAYQTNLH